MMIIAVLFGAGMVTVLTVPGLRADGSIWTPMIVAASFVLAASAAWRITPRLRARYWRHSAPAGV